MSNVKWQKVGRERKRLRQKLGADVLRFSGRIGPLSVDGDPEALLALVFQLEESIRRVRYARRLQESEISECRRDPYDQRFDPLKAAVLENRDGDARNAVWLVFLATHFGKHIADGWAASADIYGGLVRGRGWSWSRLARAGGLRKFRDWHGRNFERLLGGGRRRFGNHRKYESHSQVPDVVESFCSWAEDIGFSGLLGHAEFRNDRFDAVYRSMASVQRFGRTGRFDFLTMCAKLGLSDLEPRSPYIHMSTGPLRGARLLFGEQGTKRALDDLAATLAHHLDVDMQVIEDALCNWQKNPSALVPFRG